MFSLKNAKKKGGITGVPAEHIQFFHKAKKRVFPTQIFSLRNVIWFRMYKTREGIACPLFSAKGSITVETALVLPLFLLASLTWLSFIDVMKVTIEQQMRQQELLRTGAVYANILGTTTKGREGDYLKADYVYAVNLPIGGFGYEKVFVRQRSMVHIFNGYDDSRGDRVGESQEYVYVAKHGTVYHKKRSCYTLNVTVRQVDGASIKNKRSLDRRKYTKCKRCAKGITEAEIKKAQVYITDYGVNYHVNINCRELSRTVQVIRIEDTGGRRACHVCG